MLTIKKIFMLLLTLLVAGCQTGFFAPPVSLPIQQVAQECIPVQEELPRGFLADGKILFVEIADYVTRPPIMVLESGAEQPTLIPDIPRYSGGAYSPDRRLYAYETWIDDYYSAIVVINANGEIVLTLPWDGKWSGFYWLNSQQLEFPYFWEDYWQNAPPISDVIDVTTGARETLSPELPNPWIPGGQLMTRLVIWKAAYDPTLSLVGYIRGREGEQSFVLWSIQEQRALWELNRWSTRTIFPRWTQDGEKLAVVAMNEKSDGWDRFELYIVDRNGNAEKWVDIKGYFKDDEVEISWSPNGRYLAISPIFNPANPFLILDTANRTLMDYCVEGSSPMWSPDSTQILFTQSIGTFEKLSFVLDVISKQAGYIMKNPKMDPIGWLLDSP